MSRISSERKVTALVEAQTLIRALAEPSPAGESIKAALRRVGRKLPNWSNNRVRDVWNADDRIRIRADELDELRAAKNQNEKAAKNELVSLRERLARLESLLVQADPDFFEPQLDQIRQQIRGSSRSDFAVD